MLLILFRPNLEAGGSRWTYMDTKPTAFHTSIRHKMIGALLPTRQPPLIGLASHRYPLPPASASSASHPALFPDTAADNVLINPILGSLLFRKQETEGVSVNHPDLRRTSECACTLILV